MTKSHDYVRAIRAAYKYLPRPYSLPFLSSRFTQSRPNTPPRVNLTRRFSRAESLQDYSGPSFGNLEVLDRRERESS